MSTRGSRVSPRARQIDPLALVDPELLPIAKRLLDASAQLRLSDDSLGQFRKGGGLLPPPPPPSDSIPFEERAIAVPGGAPDVRVFIVNAKRDSLRPGILHMHGGGYVLGSIDRSLPDLQELAVALDCTVVTVGYRLAPETRYAGSMDDNYAALLWMHRNAEELGIDAARIALLGESAGGGHAALLAFSARDRGEVPVAFQALIYPMLDDRTGSSRRVPSHIGAILWPEENNRYGWRSFLGHEPGSRSVPIHAVPARRTDVSRLPPAYIAVGALDLFVEEDIQYANRLIDAGVPVELQVFPGAFHGFDRICKATAVARRFNAGTLSALRRALGIPA